MVESNLTKDERTRHARNLLKGYEATFIDLKTKSSIEGIDDTDKLILTLHNNKSYFITKQKNCTIKSFNLCYSR